jgi:hypothetical protein
MKFRFILRLFFIVCFCLGLGQPNMEVQAALPCTWTGAESNDWNNAGNWSDCSNPVTLEPKIPGSVDDVVIPDVTRDPIISIAMEAVNSITISSGGVLTVNNYFSVNSNYLTIDSGGLLAMHGINYVNYVGSNMLSIVNNGTITSDNSGSATGDNSLTFESESFTNSGTIQLTGNISSNITINSPFDNSGTVQINHGGIKITKGGTHTGSFEGNNDTWIRFDGNYFSGLTVSFEENSELDVPQVFITGIIVEFSGIFAPAIVSDLNIESNVNQTGIFRFNSPSGINYLRKITNYYGELIFSSNSNDYRILELVLGLTGIVQNNDNLEILDKFDWKGGTLKGTGTTTVANTATFPISTGTHYLDGHDLVNQTTANWNAGTIALTNDATFTNDTSSIFNANATTTMSIGTGTGNAFINNGLFTKKTDGTTTTINADFTNNSEVEVIAGELVFGGNLTSGSGTKLDLGDGSLDPGETLTLSSGAKLVGSGTLSSNLVNGGTVSPGSSPGIINVVGDYNQESGGVLEIELGGDVARTGYDQLQVTGVATLAGTLDVSLYDGFVPSNGDQFLILDAASLSGTFTTINLPTLTNGLVWETEYTETGFSISAVGAGTITGNVTYNGSITDPHDIIVSLFESVDGSPYESVHILNGASFIFENVPDGTYYVAAFLDVNDSGDGPPDPDEPVSWYVDQNGDPKAVVISAGSTVSDVNITLEDSTFKIYLPLILK